jgi:hypothetical protein
MSNKIIRAKFYVQKIEKTKYGYSPNQKEMTTVVLAPVYSQEEGTENKKFWEATPTGEVKLGTINLEAANHFELGGEYYIDFMKV